MRFTATTFAVLSAAALTNARAIDARAAGNLQTFTGAVAGIQATPVTNTGDAKRPFAVKGDSFVNLSGALQRSCDQQFNACAGKANGGDKAVTLADCTSQQSK